MTLATTNDPGPAMVFHSQIPGHDVAFCSTMSRSQQGLRSFRRPRPIEGPNRTISDRLRPRRNPFRFTHFHSDEMLAQPRAYKLSPTESGYRCNRPGSGMLRSTRLHAARSSQGPQFTRPAEGPPPHPTAINPLNALAFTRAGNTIHPGSLDQQFDTASSRSVDTSNTKSASRKEFASKGTRATTVATVSLSTLRHTPHQNARLPA